MKDMDDYRSKAKLIISIILAAGIVSVLIIFAGTDFSVSSESAGVGMKLFLKFFVACGIIGMIDVLGDIFGAAAYGIVKLIKHIKDSDE